MTTILVTITLMLMSMLGNVTAMITLNLIETTMTGKAERTLYITLTKQMAFAMNALPRSKAMRVNGHHKCKQHF